MPHGPVIERGQENNMSEFIDYLKNLGKENKSIHIKVEPLDQNISELIVGNGFVKSSKELQPSKTIILDLSKNEEEILSSMHQKTRYNIHVAERYGIVIERNNDIETFIQLLRKTARKDKFQPHEDNYYRKLISFSPENNDFQVSIFSAQYKGGVAAAALLLTYKKTGFYLHGASNYNMRAIMAPFALHWHIIRHLKEAGLNSYDMWGVDEKRWPGVTRFKNGWGGETVQHPGSFDMAISPFWYLVYEFARKII